jgi:hypothetical protein
MKKLNELLMENEVGRKYGEWTVTQFEKITYDSMGAAEGGVIKLVDQTNYNTIIIRNDLALGSPKWYTSINNRLIQDKSYKKVIESAIKSFRK